jgi:dTDP-4-dehydrorhamnose 3,5-epimerase
MIDGVSLFTPRMHADDRGTLTELFKNSQTGEPVRQVTMTTSYPGVIKAFHFHMVQVDYWCVIGGAAQVVLHDRRLVRDPVTGEERGPAPETQVVYLRGATPTVLRIPPGVLHGYRVLGSEPLTLLYGTTQEYDCHDEFRVPYDDPAIGFDWTTRFH